jgi:SNF2 family DNA or RNA helicase
VRYDGLTAQRARARFQALTDLSNEFGASETARKAKNSPFALTNYYAYIAPEDQARFEELIQRHLGRQEAGPLAFEELTRWDTWFWLHPEKVAGTEQTTTSQQFPLTIKGTKEDIIRTIQAGISPPAAPNQLLLMKLKAKAAKAKLLLQAQSTARPLAGLAGLAGFLGTLGLAGLGNLSAGTREAVGSSELAIRAILQKSKEDRSYSATDKLSFEEVMRLYNPGISQNDIKAWVWFRRSIGTPMGGGWRKFYLRDAGTSESLVTTTKVTPILDNAWRTIATVPAGVVLGKPTKKSHEYRGVNYLIFRADDNAIRFVDEKAVNVKKAGFSTSEADLTALVKAGSLYYVAGELLPYPLYAFGNMYDRDLELRKDADHIRATYGQDVYELHELAIKSARPRLLSVQNPDPRERMKILSISEFAEEFMVSTARPDVLPDDAIKGEKSLYDVFRLWLDILPKTDFKEVKAEDMKRYYLEKRPLSKNLSEAEKQTIEMYAGIEAEELFTRFLYEVLTVEDQQKLDFSWNRKFNAQASVPFHRVPVGFECSARFKKGLLQFTSAQREAIAFMETTGSGVLAYDVGVGKTMSAIITVANALYAGKCSRPIIAVPNPTYKKWVREIIGYTDEATKEFIPGVLSNTGITVNEWYNLGSDVPVAKQLAAGKVKVAANSITVVTYEGLAKIGLSSKALDIVAKELNDVLFQSGAEEKSARGKEKKRQGAYEIVGGSNAGTICDLDVLGFDYVVVDEAHNFKNIFDQVPTDDEGKKRFAISGSQSARGQKLFFLANYVQRRFGRNVLLLTATPFTNSPLEIYSMLSLVGYETMVRMGLHNLELFCETFILQGSEYVNTYDGGIAVAPVVKRFNNRLVLQKLIFNHIAYKTGEEAGVQRPCKINLPRVAKIEPDGRVRRLGPQEQTLTYLEMSPLQASNQARIISALQHRDPKDFGAIFRGLAQSLDNALSPHLVPGTPPPADYREYITESPKLHYTMECVASVKKWHEDRNESVSGQIIYMNRGKENFDLVREWLFEEAGFKRKVKFNGRSFDEVECITGGMSADKKEGIKDAFLAGVVKVIIGTATIREGIDLQTKCTVIYNLYPDWNPTDVKQLEGRGWRQCNEFGFIRVVMPLVQNSMDVFVFQKLEEKTSRVNDLWYRGDRGNVLDQESLDPEEVKFALFTDLGVLVQLEIDRQVKDAQRRMDIVAQDQKTMAEYKVVRDNYLVMKEGLRAGLHAQLLINPGTYSEQTVARMPEQMAQAYKPYWWQKLSDGQRDYLPKRITRFLTEAAAWLEAPDGSDRELIDISRDGHDLLEVGGYLYNSTNRGKVTNFLGEWGKLAKAERTFLANKGLTIKDSPDSVLASLVAEHARLKAEIEYYQKDPAYKAQALAEVEAKKARLQISGGSIEQRVAEFAALNHLLAYKFGSRATCDIPGTADDVRHVLHEPAPKPAPNNLKLLQLKAKAAKAKLLLQAQARSRA